MSRPRPCTDHGESPSIWGCPECLRHLREDNQRLKDALDEAWDNCHAWEDTANHWKSNHDNQVKINQLLRDRPDMGERAALVSRLMQENAELRARLQPGP